MSPFINAVEDVMKSVVSKVGLVGLLSLAAAVEGCAAGDEGDSSGGAFSGPEITARLADLTKTNTHSLAAIAVNAGSKALNDVLRVSASAGNVSLGGVSATIAPAKVFGVGVSGTATSLEDIRDGMAADLGETAFPTELADVRLAHLKGGQDNYYIETGFALKGWAGISMNHDAGGFGGDDTNDHDRSGDNGIGVGGFAVNVGFKKGKDIEARVIVATPEANLQTLVATNGAAIAALRAGIGDFVIPENTDQIVAMKPGESFGLRGEGTYAANFGLRAPIYIATAGPFAYTFAVSAGLTHAVDGALDIQLIRLDGDEVAVDVGITNGTLNQKSLGLFGSWGVNHDCGGSGCLDAGLGKIVRGALVSRLDDFMKTSIGGSTASTDRRLELARMHFHLSPSNSDTKAEVRTALDQALHGDLRLAQALYVKNAGDSNAPVSFDFDLAQATTSNTKNFGVEIFGLDIYHRNVVEHSGTFTVQTPEGIQNVLYDTFDKSSGWFTITHGRKLTAVSSSSVTSDNPDRAVNQANLIVQSVLGNQSVTDDGTVDNADALIGALVGADALVTLDRYGDAMQNAIDAECPIVHGAWDAQCNLTLNADTSKKVVKVDGSAPMSMADAQAKAVASFMALPKVAALGASYKDFLNKVATFRTTIRSVKVFSTGGGGPYASFAVNYRFDDKALGLLSKTDTAAYGNAVESYLATVGKKRVGGTSGDPFSDSSIAAAKTGMVSALTEFKKDYVNLLANETDNLTRILGSKHYLRLPIGIRFELDNVGDFNNVARLGQYASDAKKVHVESVSQQRAILAAKLFDNLAEASDDALKFGNGKYRLFAEQAAAYPLLATIPVENLEVGMDYSAKRDDKSYALITSASGKQVAPITSNLFDIDKMMSR